MQGEEMNVNTQLSEAIADYLEQTNGGAVVDRAEFARRYPAIQTELHSTLALLALPKRSVPTDTSAAWASFKSQVFTASTASLGEYVAQAAERGDKNLAQSGLSREAVAALQNDQTPLSEIKGYQLPQYAALAQKHGIQGSSFQSFLKWLKGVGKSFSNLATPAPSRGMMYARDKETRQPGLSDAEIKAALSQPDETEAENNKGQEENK